MAVFKPEQIRANRDFFAAKLAAEKQKADAAHWVKGEPTEDFILLDTRDRGSFARGHIQGAICAPTNELPQLMAQLPKDQVLVTYCWSQH